MDYIPVKMEVVITIGKQKYTMAKIEKFAQSFSEKSILSYYRSDGFKVKKV